MVQRFVLRCLFCFVMLLLFTSHTLWLGCLDHHKIPSSRFVAPSASKPGAVSASAWSRLSCIEKSQVVLQQLGRSLKQYLAAFGQAAVGGVSVSQALSPYASCPLPPSPLVSIFHLEWFNRAADIPKTGPLVYVAFTHHLPVARDLLLRFAAVAAIVEWLLLGYLVASIVWRWLLSPLWRTALTLLTLYFLLELGIANLNFWGVPGVSPEVERALNAMLYNIRSYFHAVFMAALSAIPDIIRRVATSSLSAANLFDASVGAANRFKENKLWDEL